MEETHKDISGEYQAVSQEPKPLYETPVVMPLGGLTVGIGQACASGGGAANNCNHPGSTADGSHCSDGPSAVATACSAGPTAANDCGTGSTAGAGCGNGDGAGMS